MDARAEIAVIGGTGFYALAGLEDVERVAVETPYGSPSADFVLGTLHGRRVAFLARHGEGHRFLPGEVPARANIYAIKQLGAERVLAVNAVGSLQPAFAPLDAVVPDQLIDRTRGRASTFFGEGLVGHISFGEPLCPQVASVLAGAAEQAGVTAHRGGTLVVTEGPAFSTRAESLLYQAWGGGIIGMTTLPEAKLAREAELCYASLCFVTDYDAWDVRETAVTADMVVQNLHRNAEAARAAISAAIGSLGADRACACGDALRDALLTARDAVPEATRRRLAPFLDRYWGPAE